MVLKARVGSGTGVEVLIAAAAVADADWRAVFSHGENALSAVRTAGGTGLVKDVARFGRFGWINLAGPLTQQGSDWSHQSLLALVGALPPEELRAVLVGSRRHQLHRRLDEAVVRQALDGDRAAVRRFRATLDDTLLQVSPWLMRTPAVTIQQLCLDTLAAILPASAKAPDASTARRRLKGVGAARLLEEVAPGVHYGPQVLDDVVLVTSPQVAPILVVVDEVDRTVILHPPLGDEGATDAGAQLRDLGRAVGDATRLRLLQELRTGARTLVDLTTALDSPRTTLLHHLALLRSAGLIEIAVVDGEPNVYTLRRDGFERLAQAAKGFPLSS
jgi:DNA-binding transcriptional ArsR family regulator